ncbi:MAG: IS4 family transposase, partial [Bacteroidota bacterium]
ELCGYISNNKSRGLIIHPCIALDADQLWVLGLSDLLVWGRPKAKKKKGTTYRDSLPAEEKESHKWTLGIRGSQESLSGANNITYVFDREADIFPLFEHIQEQGSDFVIRLMYNRKLRGTEEKIADRLAQLTPQATHTLILRGEKTRKNGQRPRLKVRTARAAKLDIRYTPVQLVNSSNTYYVLDLLEQAQSVPEGEKPIHWRLITSHKINTKSDALKIAGFYAKRWLIEELFRIVKSKGFQLESVQLRKVSSVRKMIALTLSAGLSILQLSLAKSHPKQIPIEWEFTPEQVVLLKVLSTKLEGKTDKLKNPYPKSDLLFAHWVLARLGGWKGYLSKRPPGPIRLLRGRNKFEQILHSLKLFKNEDVWEP